jgi:hypothetical protein
MGPEKRRKTCFLPLGTLYPEFSDPGTTEDAVFANKTVVERCRRESVNFFALQSNMDRRCRLPTGFEQLALTFLLSFKPLAYLFLCDQRTAETSARTKRRTNRYNLVLCKGRGEVCKTFIHRFDSGPRLQPSSSHRSTLSVV